MSNNSEQLERIVAYLDGELSAEESAQVEQQLASDEQFRQQLQGAERAWSALDELPMPHVGEDFSRTTMEMVVDAARYDLQAKTVALPVQRRKRKTTNALLIAMTLLLGVLAARVVSQNPNRRLVAALPIIQNVDIYSQFESVDFLRDLQRSLGGDAEKYSADEQQLQDELETYKIIAEEDLRKHWLVVLDADEQTTLRGKLNRFHDLPTKKQESLRQIHRELEADKDRDQLLQTMFVYEQWLDGLDPSEQYELRDMPADERVRFVTREMERMAGSRSFDLSDEQLKALFEEVKPYIQRVIRENADDFRKAVIARSGRDPQRFDALPARSKSMFVFLFAMRNSRKEMRDFIDTVVAALPDEMQDDFRRLPPEKRQEVIVGWFRRYHTQASGSRRPGKVSEQELEEFFVEVLEPKERERLLALPREEMQRQLRRMYLFKSPHRGPRGPLDMLGGPPDGRRPGERRPGERRPGGPRGEGDWRDGPPPRDGRPRDDRPRGDRRGRPRFDEDGPPPPRFDGDRRFEDDRERPPRRRRDDGPRPEED